MPASVPARVRRASAAAGLLAMLFGLPADGAAALNASTTAGGRTTMPDPLPCPSCWHPDIRTSFDWVLSRVPQPPYRNVEMYDVDVFETSKDDVAAMHAAGMHVACYIDAGTWERWRRDADRFPRSLLGRKNGWPGERWLDIRDLQQPDSVLRSILAARLDMCASKRFDAVELDNVDGYLNKTGFALHAADQLFFDATLANDAHERGLSALQKNDNEQIPKLLPYFDGALNEQCNQYRECTTKQNGRFGLDQYVAAGKPVFQVEYKLKPRQFCPQDNANDFNGARMDLRLDGKVFHPCR